MSASDPEEPVNLRAVLHDWHSCRVTIVGDVMLDKYVYGNADRLSPDAPVPVLCVTGQESRLGGAALVAQCVAALQCQATCIGVVGDDSAGEELRAMLAAVGCKTQGILYDHDRPTTVKQSMIGLAQHRHAQKMFRVDIEKRDPVPAVLQKKLLAATERSLAHTDILCIEDYNKGVVTESLCRDIIRLAKSKRVPVVVDPAPLRDFSKYRGATTITPNRTEATQTIGWKEPDCQDKHTLIRTGQELLKVLDLECIVMTLDKQGALLVKKKGRPAWARTKARQVYDVTGAGDVFVAALSCALGNDAGWEAAAAFANCAAGLKVERFGVLPIHLSEILNAFDQTHGNAKKCMSPDALRAELKVQREAGKRIVFTNGCFDVLHAGHVSLLRAARSHGDILVVGINSDRSVRRIKGSKRPVNTEAARIEVLSELQCVTHIVSFDDETPLSLIHAIMPDVLVKGADYKEEEVVGGSVVKAYGGNVVLIPLTHGMSTTEILRALEPA